MYAGFKLKSLSVFSMNSKELLSKVFVKAIFSILPRSLFFLYVGKGQICSMLLH